MITKTWKLFFVHANHDMKSSPLPGRNVLLWQKVNVYLKYIVFRNGLNVKLAIYLSINCPYEAPTSTFYAEFLGQQEAHTKKSNAH